MVGFVSSERARSYKRGAVRYAAHVSRGGAPGSGIELRWSLRNQIQKERSGTRSIRSPNGLDPEDRGTAPGALWQEGYGAFSTGPKHLEPLRRYIANQEAHHLQSEYRRLLAPYNLEYDERYVWD